MQDIVAAKSVPVIIIANIDLYISNELSHARFDKSL